MAGADTVPFFFTSVLERKSPRLSVYLQVLNTDSKRCQGPCAGVRFLFATSNFSLSIAHKPKDCSFTFCSTRTSFESLCSTAQFFLKCFISPGRFSECLNTFTTFLQISPFIHPRHRRAHISRLIRPCWTFFCNPRSDFRLDVRPLRPLIRGLRVLNGV